MLAREKHMERLLAVVTVLIVSWLPSGCRPNYQQLRHEGQTAMLEGEYGSARILLGQAEDTRHRRVENLHDMAVCSMMLAKAKFEQRNYPAAMREIDAAIDFYSRAINELPGHLASLEGKNIALEMKGRFEEALKHTEWAVKFVGPSARQYLILAGELEERGDKDGALLRYRQAVAMEPSNVDTHRRLAKFLLANRKESAAVAHLQEAHRLDPGDPWVLGQLAAHGVIPGNTMETRTP